MTKLAKAAKRKSDMIEERNNIALFSWPDMADRPETKEFFDGFASAHLARALKKRVERKRMQKNA